MASARIAAEQGDGDRNRELQPLVQMYWASSVAACSPYCGPSVRSVWLSCRLRVVIPHDVGHAHSVPGLGFKLGSESEKRCDRWIVACDDSGGQLAAMLGLVKEMRKTFQARLPLWRECFASLSRRGAEKGPPIVHTVIPCVARRKVANGCIGGAVMPLSG
jgi:hypothetical protein